jgi:anti-sigma factor RsiW
MKRKPSVEHIEDAVILAYLDGELSGATWRKAKHHLQSCWNCRSAAAELELLAQTAYALLSGGDEADSVLTDIAKAGFLRQKAKATTIPLTATVISPWPNHKGGG